MHWSQIGRRSHHIFPSPPFTTTPNVVTLNTHVLSYSFWSLRSKMNITGLTSACFSKAGSFWMPQERSLCLPFPASRGHPPSLAHGPESHHLFSLCCYHHTFFYPVWLYCVPLIKTLVITLCLPIFVVILVAKLCLTLYDPMVYNLSDSSVHGISQARILRWGAISFSRWSSGPRDWSHVSCADRQIFTTEPLGKTAYLDNPV